MPEYDVVVVGAGTAGCYAAATTATAGLETVILERKSPEQAGEIACGDAIKGADQFPESIPFEQIEPAFTNTEIDHGRFEMPQVGETLEIPIPGKLAVIDRPEYGRRLIDGATDAGATIEYETVVNDVCQADEGTVTGVQAIQDGDPIAFDAEVVVDAAGALSILQDKTDFSGTTFDTNVDIRQFCSAYREIIEVDEPVEYDDALVFKPTDRAAGYVWYFPRTATEINAGLGFQMTEQPMELVDALKRDLRTRPELQGGEITSKLGAAVPTRRPYDSAVAPGFVAVGDAAGHVNPTTGGGIAGAAYAGTYAAEAIIDALESGAPTEAALWEYNERVMDHFGARFAALDVYNILSTAVDTDAMMQLLAAVPGEKIAESLYSGSTSLSPLLALRTAIDTFGHWKEVYRLYRTKQRADEVLEQYESYPSSPDGLSDWQQQRDALMDAVYETTGAEPKY